MITVALVPGHSFEDQNFTLWTGETEWSLGNRACEFMKAYWKENFLNIEAELFRRKKEKYYSREIKKVAKKIKAWNSSVDFVFEHHVNAFKRIALGCEGLYDVRSEASGRFVDKMTDAFSEAFMVKERKKWTFENGDKGDGLVPLTKNDRGAAPCYYMDAGAKMAMLWEGCFGNLKHGESIRVFEDDIAYFTWLAKYIGKELGGIERSATTTISVPARPVPQTPTPIEPEPIQHAKLRNLVSAYKKAEIEFPNLKEITLAQWLLESGRATSKLSIDHNNFAGLKWRDEMRVYAKPVEYNAHDGRTKYCKFERIEKFIKGYWGFLDRRVYDGWKHFADDGEMFLRYIVEAGYCPDNGYQQKVLALVPEAKKLLESSVIENSIPVPPAPQPTPDPIVKKKSFWEKLFGWLF